MVMIKQSFASLAERRHLRKHAQPEHAYTGYVPSEHIETDPVPVRGKIKHAIVGYQGHRHNKQDMIGVTFTKGLEKCTPSLIPKAVAKKLQHNKEDSGYGQFDVISGYGEFQAPPSQQSDEPQPITHSSEHFSKLNQTQNVSLKKHNSAPKEIVRSAELTGEQITIPNVTKATSGARGKKSHIQFADSAKDDSDSGGFSCGGSVPQPRGSYDCGEFAKTGGNSQFAAPPKAASGYGEFAGASGYGQFAAPPKAASGYGEFAGASGYGQFAAPPKAASGYGEFAGASGYGQFAAPPKAASGYGEFAGASGYGQFAAPPKAASGYGEFAGASGYGQFAAPPKAASGYGEFAGASGYGQFAAPPKGASGYGEFAGVSGYGQFAAPPKAASGYGEFAGASGYGQFAAPPKAASGYGEFAGASGYGQFAAPPKAASGYGEFAGASGYGQFAAPPENIPSAQPQELPNHPKQAKGQEKKSQRDVKPNPQKAKEELQFDLFCKDEALRSTYLNAIKQIGGPNKLSSIVNRICLQIQQKHSKQSHQRKKIQASFLQKAHSDGNLDRARLREALFSLNCNLSDDELIALFCQYDPSCTGQSTGD